MKFNIHGYTAILVFLGGGSDRYNNDAGCNGITGQGNRGGNGSRFAGAGGGGAGSAGNSALGTGQ